MEPSVESSVEPSVKSSAGPVQHILEQHMLMGAAEEVLQPESHLLEACGLLVQYRFQLGLPTILHVVATVGRAVGAGCEASTGCSHNMPFQ